MGPVYGVFTLPNTETETKGTGFHNNVWKSSYFVTDANFHWVLYTFYRYRSRSRSRCCLGQSKWTISQFGYNESRLQRENIFSARNSHYWQGCAQFGEFWTFCYAESGTPRGVLDLLNFVPIHGVNTSIVMLRGVFDCPNFGCFVLSRGQNFHCNTMKNSIKAGVKWHKIQEIDLLNLVPIHAGLDWCSHNITRSIQTLKLTRYKTAKIHP